MATSDELHHESGDASEWTSAVGTGFSITAAAALADTGFGAQLDVADGVASTNYLLVTADTYTRFRCYFDPNSITLTEGTSVMLFGFASSGGWGGRRGAVELGNNSGVLQLRPYWATSTSTWGTIVDGPNLIELEVFKDASGYAKLWINGTLTGTVSRDTTNAVTLFQFSIADAYTPSGASGTVYLDQVVITTDTSSVEIGPYTGQPEGMITHEGGTNGEWTNVVNGPTMSVISGAALAGTGYGLNCVIDGTAFDWYQQDVVFPVDSVYRARFYFDPNSVVMANGDEFGFFVCYGNAKNLWYVGLDCNDGGGVPTRLMAYANNAAVQYTALTDEPHYVEVLVDGAAGTLDVFLDSIEVLNFTGASVMNEATTSLRVGALITPDAGSSGDVFLDEIVWRPYNVEIGEWDANILDVDFETGSVEGGTVTVGGSATVGVNPDDALASTNFGGLVTFDGTQTAYISYTLPGVDQTAAFRARFYLDATGTTTDATDGKGPFTFLSASLTEAGFYFDYSGGVKRLFPMYRTDGGLLSGTPVTLTDGEHWVEIEYLKHASSGHYKWWLDGVSQEELTGLTTNINDITRVYVGTFSTPAAASGTMKVDEVIVRNSSTPIGTDGAGAGFPSGGAPQIWRFCR